MRTEILAQEHWEASYRRRIAQTVGDPRQATALLRLAQGQGLGVPIEAAFGFDSWLKGQTGSNRVWDALFAALFSKIDLDALGTTQRAILDALRLAPFDAAYLLFLPAVRRVLRMVGRNVLLSVHPAGEGASEEVYQRHVVAFDGALNALAGGDAAEAIAWRRALALDLVRFCRGNGAVETDVSLPHDIEGSAHFLAAPLSAGMVQHQQEPDHHIAFGTVRREIRFNYDGVTGIRHASPSEDPSNMVPTQLVYPYAFLMERIANEGFTAFARPPPLPQDTDILFLAVIDDVDENAAVSMVRAAWWLAARRAELGFAGPDSRVSVGWMARRAGHLGRDSVLRHVEGDAAAVDAMSRQSYVTAFPALHAPFVTAPLARDEARAAPALPEDRSMLEQIEALGVRMNPARRDRLKLFLLDIAGEATRQDDARSGRFVEELRAISPERLSRCHVTFAVRDGDDHGGVGQRIVVDGIGEWEVPASFAGQSDVVGALRDVFLGAMMGLKSDG